MLQRTNKFFQFSLLQITNRGFQVSLLLLFRLLWGFLSSYVCWFETRYSDMSVYGFAPKRWKWGWVWTFDWGLSPSLSVSLGFLSCKPFFFFSFLKLFYIYIYIYIYIYSGTIKPCKGWDKNIIFHHLNCKRVSFWREYFS